MIVGIISRTGPHDARSEDEEGCREEYNPSPGWMRAHTRHTHASRKRVQELEDQNEKRDSSSDDQPFVVAQDRNADSRKSKYKE
jgi:hypothetical protein